MGAGQLHFYRAKHGKLHIEDMRILSVKNQDKKPLLLELGVGDMTPSVIKLPFWNMADKFPETFLVTVNLAKESSPEQLKGRSLAVCEDLSLFLHELKENM